MSVTIFCKKFFYDIPMVAFHILNKRCYTLSRTVKQRIKTPAQSICLLKNYHDYSTIIYKSQTQPVLSICINDVNVLFCISVCAD